VETIEMNRIIGILLSCVGVVFLAEYFLTTAHPLVNDVDIRTIHEDINNAIEVVTDCFVILFGLILYTSHDHETQAHESVVKTVHNLTEIEASSLVRESKSGSFELDESSVEELAVQYQMECPHRNVDDIITLKSLEISGIAQLLPSEVRHLFEPLLKEKLLLIDETRIDKE